MHSHGCVASVLFCGLLAGTALGASSTPDTLRVEESSARASLQTNQVKLTLPLSRPATAHQTIRVRLLAPDDKQIAAQESALSAGSRNVEMEFGKLDVHESELPWVRGNYQILEGGQQISSGAVSLGAIDPELYSLTVAHPSFVERGQPFTFRVTASNPVTHAAVRGAKILSDLEIDSSEEEEKHLHRAAVTDSKGEVVIAYQIPDFDVTDASLIVRGLSKRSADNHEVETLEINLSVEHRQRVLIQTDKQLFQPGQTVHIRALAIGPDRKMQQRRNLVLTITDAKGEDAVKEQVETDRFGVASFDWKLDEHAQLGPFQIAVGSDEDDGSRSEFGRNQSRITVSRYELPEFVVNAEADRRYYLPDQKPAVKISARYLFGKPVVEGHVRLVREDNRRWNSNKQQWEVESADELTGTLDSQGELTLKPTTKQIMNEFRDETYSRLRDLSYSAYVTDDTTGRTEQRRFFVRLTQEPIHIYLVKTGGDVRDGEYVISTQYPDGAPAECDVVVQHVVDMHASDGSTRQVRKPVTQTHTNRYGLAKIRMRLQDESLDAHSVSLILEVKDSRGVSSHFDDSIYFANDERAAIWISTDKTLLAPDDPIRAVVHAQAGSLVEVDLLCDGIVLRSSELTLRKDSADVFFRKDERFHGEMELRAYSLKNASRYGISTASKRFLYPEHRNLNVKFVGLPSVLHPGAVVEVGLKLNDAEGATPGIFGVAVTDKAVDERSRTEAEFANVYRNWDFDFGAEVGGIRRSDLDQTDMSRPVPDGLDLAAERILSEEYGEGLRVERDDEASDAARSEFESKMEGNLRILARAIDASDQDPTADLKILRKLAEAHDVSPAVFLDAWQQPYQAQLSLEWAQYALTFKSAGPDKIFDTQDDFSLSVLSRSIFGRYGRLLSTILGAEIASGDVPATADAVLRIAKGRGLDLESLRDPWGHPYRFETRLFRQWLGVYVYTRGDGNVLPNSNGYMAWESSFDFFGKTEQKLSVALQASVSKGHQFPHSEQEMFDAAREGGIDLAGLRDPLGKPYEIKFRDAQINTLETQVSGAQGEVSAKTTPVTRSLRILEIVRSPQSQAGSKDVETEQNRVVAEFLQPYDRQSGRDLQPSKIDEGSFRADTGAIGGTVLDPSGAVIPNASVKILLADYGAALETKSDRNGKFLLRDLKPGFYTISALAPGFQTMQVRDVLVSSASLTRVDVTLHVAAASETVEVSAETSNMQASTQTSMLAHSTKISTPAGSAVIQTLDFTPRLRHDFQETAYWAPALVTNSSGRAQLHFKLPDNLTTWKVVAFGSTVDGRMGSAEREFQSFQPFFVDLDSPPVLTVGDQISPPVILRNYGKSSATMNVTIGTAPWFELLSPATTEATVPAGGSSNVPLSFRASNSTAAGKQRVTATNHRDGDAVEKTVRVHPDGEPRHVLAGGLVGDSSHPMLIHIPEEAIPGSVFTRLTVYPNLGSHISRSVEAALERPYGCGEQTISSAYPSLLLLELLQATGQTSPRSIRAKKYLQQGYDRLTNYFDPSGGLTYWGREEKNEQPDPALTAYGIEFLKDASALIAIDESRITRARDWLLQTQLSDGDWYGHFGKGDPSSILFVALALAQSANPGDSAAQKQAVEKAVRKAESWVKQSAAAAQSPYDVALGLRIANALHDREAVAKAREKLLALSDVDSRGRHWEINASSPFYGWGRAGDLETTAMAVQALEESCSDGVCENDPVVAESIHFLLKSKDQYGVWYSGQATVQVLRALLPLARKQMQHAHDERLRARINGKDVSDADLALLQPTAEIADAPRSLDISPYLIAGDNTVEVTSDHGVPFASTQAISEYYVPWRDREAREKSQPGKDSGLVFGTHCNLAKLQVGTETQCFVKVKRFGANRGGMLLAQVGLPPGAEVDRASLKQLLSTWQIARDELQPDKLIFYVWSGRAEGEEFSFKMKLRYPVTAQSAASELMDYYNPDLQVVLAPQKFTVVKAGGNYLAAASHDQ